MAERTIIRHAVSVYKGLLWLYPRAHRRDYGPLMTQLFRDQCVDAYGQRRFLGLLIVWLRTLWDLGLTAFQEHMRLAADLGLANQPVKPLPWWHVLLAILPGLWLMIVRAELIPWLLGWRRTASMLPPVMAYETYPVLLRWLDQGWLYLACVLLAWSWWRNRRLVRWVYPIAGLVVFELPMLVLSLIFQQDGMTPLSPFGRVVMAWWVPLAFLFISLVVLWKYRRRIRASGITWLAVALLLGSFGFGLLGIYIVVLFAVPAALGLLLVRQDRLYATLFVLGIVWWFADGILDPSYGLLIWTDAYATVHVIAMLPALFTLVLPVLWVLRARTTYQQLAGLIVPPFVGVILMEVARFLVLYGTERGVTVQEGIFSLGSAVQIAAMLALVAITYAQFDGRSKVIAES